MSRRRENLELPRIACNVMNEMFEVDNDNLQFTLVLIAASTISTSSIVTI